MTAFILKVIRLLAYLAPGVSARIARHLFRSPKIAPTKAWEVQVEAQAERSYLSNGISYLRWPVANPVARVIAIHGWEGRATQWGPLAEVLQRNGIETIALDGPAHGKSTGRFADPLLFAQALLDAESELGPFDAVLGHSMGAGASVFAFYRGLDVKKIVYIAGPASFAEVVDRFAHAFGLTPRARRAFIRQVEKASSSPDPRDVMAILSQSSVQGLIVHDREDDDVPFSDAERLHQAWPDSQLLTTEGLGHKRVLRDPAVMDQVLRFLTAAN